MDSSEYGQHIFATMSGVKTPQTIALQAPDWLWMRRHEQVKDKRSVENQTYIKNVYVDHRYRDNGSGAANARNHSFHLCTHCVLSAIKYDSSFSTVCATFCSGQFKLAVTFTKARESPFTATG